jgi:hypothetical protein
MYNKPIRNIDEYVKTSNTLIDSGFFTFRGQCCSSWALEPGVIRKIKKTYTGIGQSGLLFRLSVDHVIGLIKKARDNGHFKDDDCDLNVLAILQHFGAATQLLDFSNDPLVALYFACQPCKENNDESNGKIFCINYPSQMRSSTAPLRPITDPSQMNIETILDDASRYIWYWEPHYDLCKRSEKQQSVFVFGWGLYWKYDTEKLIDELKILIISGENKKDILKELEERYDISEHTLFPDIYGFAQSNSHDKIIKHFSAEEFYYKGEEQWRDGSPEWAAEYYKMAYTKKSGWVDARCKCALALNWNGEQSKALDIINESIEQIGKNWKFFACKSIINQRMETDWKADMRIAEEIAHNQNESSEFRIFVNDYSSLNYY